MEEHVHVRGEMEWKTSLWSLPCSHACPLSIFCPCGVYYKTAELLTGAGYRPSCCKSLACGCCCFGGLSQRGMLRAKYNLKGGECSDFWVHCCCQCLALGQVYRETRAWAKDPDACCPKAIAAAAKTAQNRAARNVGPGRPHDLDSSREENEQSNA